MHNDSNAPTLRQLNEKKVRVGVWVPPVVRKQLDALTEADGIPISNRLAEAATTVAFPALAPVPRYRSVEDMASGLVDMGLARDLAHAQSIIALARQHFGSGGDQ